MRAYRVITTIWTSCVASAIATSWVWCMFYVQRFLSEPVRPGTVVSILFPIVLGSANYWGMIPSLAASITAAMFFVTYFQPPLGRFAATPQGWVSTTSFVLASLRVSHLSARGRRSAAEAIQHSRESQLIEQFGRGLLACCGCQLVASTAVNEAVGLFGASAAANSCRKAEAIVPDQRAGSGLFRNGCLRRLSRTASGFVMPDSKP